METLKEMLQFMKPTQRLDLKAVAMTHVLNLTGTPEGLSEIHALEEMLFAIFGLTYDQNPTVAKDAVLSLINLTADIGGAVNIHETIAGSGLPLVEDAVRHITDEESELADPWSMVLSNLTRFESLVERVLSRLEKDEQTLYNLAKAFAKLDYNKKNAKLHYLGPVFCNLTQTSRGRELFCHSKYNLLDKVLPFASYEASIIRRGGTIGILKNICFDPAYHDVILNDKDDILNILLYPLCGPEEFTEEENEKFPMELQYLDESKTREEDPDLRKMLLESLLQLCATKRYREFLRSKGVYEILREYHKWEAKVGKDADCLLACENVIDILINPVESSLVPVKELLKGRVKLSGAGRKRLKALVAKGIPLETARSLALKPASATGAAQATTKSCNSGSTTITSSTKPDKRIASEVKLEAEQSNTVLNSSSNVPIGQSILPTDKETNIVEVTKRNKVAACTPTSVPTLPETVNSKKIAIIPLNYPEDVWSTEQIDAIQKCILQVIFESRNGTIKPHFAGCIFKTGFLTINCLDDETVVWLKQSAPLLKPWEGAVLKVVDEKEVPKTQIFIGNFSNSDDWNNDRILGQVEAQNSSIRLGEWRVLNRSKKGELIELVIALDPLSAETVRKLDNKVYYGFGTAELRPRLKGSHVKAAENGSSPVDDNTTISQNVRTPPAKRASTWQDATVWPHGGKRHDNSFQRPQKFFASGRLRKWEKNDSQATAFLCGTKNGNMWSWY